MNNGEAKGLTMACRWLSISAGGELTIFFEELSGARLESRSHLGSVPG